MHILGVNCYGHDSAAALLIDGRLSGAVEEERFVRKKHIGDFPENAIGWCCDNFPGSRDDIEHIVFYWDPYSKRLEYLKHLLRYFPRSLMLLKSRFDKEPAMYRFGSDFKRRYPWSRDRKFHFAPHHLCHAASAFYPSPFERAAVMTIDAVGEWDCTWLGHGCGNRLHGIRGEPFPNSLGIVYGAVTEFLGFKFASGEGKVMGLAPYGDPDRYREVFRDVIQSDGRGEYRVNLSYFAYHYVGRPRWFDGKFFRKFGLPRTSEGEISQNHMDIAAALQRRLEEVAMEMAISLQRQTRLHRLCLAGGVCLNASMNGHLLRHGPFEEIFVQPAANDAGCAYGAALWLWHDRLDNGQRHPMRNAFFGPARTQRDIDDAITSVSPACGNVHRFEDVSDLCRQTARLIAAGRTIGWFQGAMELGPRALGNRSILADPRRPDMAAHLNAHVKYREWFRPFAPAVLQLLAGQWFELNQASPFMTIVVPVRPSRRCEIPAVTHIDGTARIQTVDEETNPLFFQLISEFHEITGVPMLLNTSFNVRGHPIVNTLADAIKCFVESGLDAVVLGSTLLTKTDAEPSAQDITGAVRSFVKAGV